MTQGDKQSEKSGGQRSNLVLWWNLGWSGTDPEKRMVGRLTPEGGWPSFIDNRVMPHVLRMIKHGFAPRIMLHNPWGVDPGEKMEGDQYIEALEAGLRWLTRDFARAMRPLQAIGCEIISYMGGTRHDDDFRYRLESGQADKWYRRWWRSYRLPMRVGSVAFDAMGNTPKEHVEHHAVRSLVELWSGKEKHNVYIEASPELNMTHWHDLPVVIVEKTYRQRHKIGEQKDTLKTRFPLWQPEMEQWVTRAGAIVDYVPDMLRLINKNFLVELAGGGFKEAVESIWSDGHTAVVHGDPRVGPPRRIDWSAL